jgi:hypothetical protein
VKYRGNSNGCILARLRAAALAKSIARIPENLESPAIKPASPIGAALDLLVNFEASQNG